MAKLRSIGLDIGTSTTQMILSELTVENRASSFAVPEMDISGRRILYQSPIHFTPLLSPSRMDGEGIRKIVEAEYRSAGITRQEVDTGAVIITGESSRKENARAVLEALSELAGDFVVATAGPDLESALAARGAGADRYSAQSGKTVLHMDIGGGTSNLALIEDGRITATGCLNVGGRLIKLDKTGKITYISPVLEGLTDFALGQTVTQEQILPLAKLLTEALEMAAGLRPRNALFNKLYTQEAGPMWASAPANAVISFSGGVADCIERSYPWLAFGDMGPVLGKAIRESRLCRGDYRLGEQTVRATVIGAGCHSAQLSGSTVFARNVTLPLKNLPVVPWGRQSDTAGVLAVESNATGYGEIQKLAEQVGAWGQRELYLAMEQDQAKALGQALALRYPDRPILCLDRLRLSEGSYLDVGNPVGPAFPVVIKTLIMR
jgi:ethanolamine utilization protein EutA